MVKNASDLAAVQMSMAHFVQLMMIGHGLKAPHSITLQGGRCISLIASYPPHFQLALSHLGHLVQRILLQVYAHSSISSL